MIVPFAPPRAPTDLTMTKLATVPTKPADRTRCPAVRPSPKIRDAYPLFSRDGGNEHLGQSTFIAQEDMMHETYRIIGWAALLAGLSFLGQPIVVALVPAVFGTSEMVTDPAVLHGAVWFAFLEAGLFLGIAVGMGLLVIGIDELLGSVRSVTGRAHILVGIAAAFGWLLVASAGAARYSSVIGLSYERGEPSERGTAIWSPRGVARPALQRPPRW